MKELRLSVFLAAATLIGGVVDAQALFTVTSLNQLPTPGGGGLGLLSGATEGAATAINNSGLVVGSVCCYTNKQRATVEVAVVWHGTIPTALPMPSGMPYRTSCAATAVNKSGITLGFANIRPHPSGAYYSEAVVWNGGVITALGDLNGTASAAY